MSVIYFSLPTEVKASLSGFSCSSSVTCIVVRSPLIGDFLLYD